jgi:anion-transporting  ArsA/GET3 family ATPase
MEILICLGTGGVGKTSVSAALALRASLAGRKALVLTIDPAKRLRTALRMDAEQEQQRVSLESLGAAETQMWAALLDVRATLDRAVQTNADPNQAKRVLEHPIYKILISSLSGMEELMAIERLDQAIQDGFETIVIDTAPSRHALEFLDKPEFFVDLVSFPLVQLVRRFYQLWEKTPLMYLSRKTMELYSRVEILLGAKLVRQILDFYSVFRTVAEGYAGRAKRTAALLRDDSTAQFCIISTPSKARLDAHYFWTELNDRNFPVRSLIINRSWVPLERPVPEHLSPLLKETALWYHDISQTHERIWQEVSQEFQQQIPNVVKVPELTRDVDGLAALQKIAENLDLR